VDYKLTRAHITLNNVVWQQLPGTTIADIRLAAFSQGVSEDLQRALSEAAQQHITGIVLDLRNNPGGLLSEAVGVTSQFVVTGNVLLEQDAHGNITPVSVQHASQVTKLPMVILIDEGTASAAEITAGALQDAQRAQLIGDTTFGTGTVLNEFNLADGSAMLMAVQEWLTPSGRVIWHKGITPDVSITLGRDTAPLTPEAQKGMTAAQVRASGDAQLLKGIELLTGKPY
jgi:carboxyl-terminal processing protease